MRNWRSLRTESDRRRTLLSLLPAVAALLVYGVAMLALPALPSLALALAATVLVARLLVRANGDREFLRELHVARAELEVALRARDEFLAIASHELKTPLTSLKLRAQTLNRALARDGLSALTVDRVQSLVEQTDKQVARLARLIEDMLDISKIRSGRLVMDVGPAQLGAIVEEAVGRMRPHFAAAGCELLLEANTEELPVRVDRLRVDQVVTNLLTNALRYGLGHPVRVELGRDESAAYVRVIDQGLGVAPEDQEKIFERFERAISANEVSGLGLGLYISRRFAEALGGTIRLRSALGRGSTFELRLPLDVAGAGAGSAPPAAAPALRRVG